MPTLPLIAGILSPGLLTVGLFIWQNRWKKDALSLNGFKCSFATLFFGVIVLSFRVHGSKSQYDVIVLGYMMLSSLLGIIIADTWWLIALERIGARRMITIDAVKPFLALAFGSFVLQDKVGTMAIIGIVLTSLGILLVNLEKREEKEDLKDKNNLHKDDSSLVPSPLHPSGVIQQRSDIVSTLNLLGLEDFALSLPMRNHLALDEVIQLGQEYGLSSVQIQSFNNTFSNTDVDSSADIELTIKTTATSSQVVEMVKDRELTVVAEVDFVAYFYALGNVVLDVYAATIIVEWHGSLSSADVNLIRFGFASVVLLSAIGIKKQKLSSFKFMFQMDSTAYDAPMSKHDWMAVSGGIVFVTVLTPLINTWVLFKLPLAIAITLNSTSPLWSLPVAYIHHEVISFKAVLGALLATGGIVMLVLG